jgi:hypothetical protein
MTDNLDRVRAARFAAEWKKGTDLDSAVYHLSAVEVAVQGGPLLRCVVTITFEPEPKFIAPNTLKIEKHQTVNV